MDGLPTLVIGASGAVGSEIVRQALGRKEKVVAFLRTPSKLPKDISAIDPNLQILQGDASSDHSVHNALLQGGRGIRAVVVAAPYADMRGTSSKLIEIVQNVIAEVSLVQQLLDIKIKVWWFAGASLMAHPSAPDRHLSSFLPFTFFPETVTVYRWLEQKYDDVNWTAMCPGQIKSQAADYHEPGLVEGITFPPHFASPNYLSTIVPFELGFALNIIRNIMSAGQISPHALATYILDHLEVETRLKGKRVQVVSVRPACRKATTR